MAHSVTLEPARPRRVIVHYHLMKCAGTTIAAILEREFGDACYHVHRPRGGEIISSDELAAFLRATPQARAVNHHARYPVPRGAGEIFDCCPIRRPMDRLESLYEFMARDSTQLLHPLAAGGVARFFDALMEDRPGNIIEVQTAALSMVQETARQLRRPRARDSAHPHVPVHRARRALRREHGRRRILLETRVARAAIALPGAEHAAHWVRLRRRARAALSRAVGRRGLRRTRAP